MKNVRRGILASQGGYTLIAVIVEATVLLVSFLGLYIGIVYAEAQLIQNYRTRVATLLAAGEVDWQIYYLDKFKRTDSFISKDVVIQDNDGIADLNGTMSLNVYENTDLSTGNPIDYTVVEVTVRWVDPADNQNRSVMVREDYF